MLIKANPPHFTILATSNQFLKITHLQRKDLLGKSLFDIFPGKRNDSSEMLSSYETFVKVIETKSRVELPTFKYKVLNPETGRTEEQYWSNYHEPILDAQGNVSYIINTTTNITGQVLETTEKEMALNRLKVQEQNIQNMVRQAPVGMCILKGDPFFAEEINDNFLELVGKSRWEFKLKPYWEVIVEAAVFYEPITTNVLQTGKTYHAKEHEIMLIRKGREEIVYVDFVYEPMKDVDGSVFAIMIVAIDVTDKVLARKELQSAYEQLRLSKQAAQLGTFDMDLIKRTMDWDERCRLLFGITHKGPVTYENDFVKGIHPEDKERVLKLIDDLFKKVIPNGDYDTTYRTIGAEDGKLRWVRAKGKVIFNEKEEAIRFIGSALEITRQKEDEQRKNDFIGMVSHELKTPLTSLSAYVQVLQGKAQKSQDSFSVGALEKVDKQVKKMSAMINGFLNISRLESGKINISKQSFNIEDLVKESIEETLITISGHNITLVPCNTTTVYADRDKIASVISNMLSNAVKYSEQGKNVEVRCQISDDDVHVSVKDEGIGIKAPDIEKLFERYYRVETDTTKHISGFGIGLYLSAEIIKRHDGKIWVESEPGRGSTFFFSLPLSRS